MCKIYFADVESTGLLHHLVEQGDKAKLHNFCAMSVETEQMWTFHTDTEEQRKTLSKFLDREIILVMHNGICYDKNALKHFGYNVDKIHFVDTLALSWYLCLERPKHGLEDWGIEAGVPKPEISDWENLTQQDYDHRVQEDVKIQRYTYKKLKSMFEELYGKMTDYEFCTHKVVKYLNFKMEQLEEQQNTKFRVDVPHAKSVIEKLEKEIEFKTEQLKAVMPKVPVYAKHTRPAKPFKKDGSLSSTGEKWKKICELAGVDFNYDGEIKTIKSYEEPKPSSSQQIKAWLDSLGWIPETFKFVKDENGERKIPQIYKPQSGGQVCDSIAKLSEDNPELEHLVGLGVLSHRKSCVQGFIDSIVVGDLAEAGASGFTNTLRLKHRKPFVNLPSGRVLYGEEVRGCVIAKEGWKFVCSDLSSMENLWKFNYQLPYDREYVNSQMSDDFDPHLSIAQEGGLLSKAEVSFYKIVKEGFPKENYEQSLELNDLLKMPEDEQKKKLKQISEIRGKGKGTNYSCQYGAGASTVARTAGVPLNVGKMLVKAYKKMNWSIDAIVKDQVRKTVSHGTYQLNPYNGIWYHLKTEKDSFSTLVQGSGSYLLDLWLKSIDIIKKEKGIKEKLKLCAQMHDENMQEYQSLTDDEVSAIFQEALDKVNKHLGVEIKFGCDTQHGFKYSEIH